VVDAPSAGAVVVEGEVEAGVDEGVDGAEGADAGAEPEPGAVVSLT
jgi:hypothetical protein